MTDNEKTFIVLLIYYTASGRVWCKEFVRMFSRRNDALQYINKKMRKFEKDKYSTYGYEDDFIINKYDEKYAKVVKWIQYIIEESDINS